MSYRVMVKEGRKEIAVATFQTMAAAVECEALYRKHGKHVLVVVVAR